MVVEKNEKTGEITVEGNSCPKGKTYAITEMTDPRRMVTSTVVLKGNKKYFSVPVKTSEPIEKSKIFNVMKEIEKVQVSGDIALGQKIIANVSDTGADIVATRTIKA